MEKEKMFCPYCGTEIIAEDVIDSEDRETEILTKVFGVCSKCKKEYVWYEHFKYFRSNNLTEC